MTTRFDTLRYMRRLEDAGVPQQQAEAHIATLAEALEEAFGDVVRSSELANVATDLKEAMAAEFRARDLKWDAQFEQLKEAMAAGFRAQDMKWEARFNERAMKWDARLQQMDTKWEGKFNVLYYMMGTLIALVVFLFTKVVFF